MIMIELEALKVSFQLLVYIYVIIFVDFQANLPLWGVDRFKYKSNGEPFYFFTLSSNLQQNF